MVAESDCVAAAATALPRNPLAVAAPYVELCKARLSALVVMTTGAGFVLALPDEIGWLRLLWTVLGTYLAACGANALNQWLETEPDERMQRTRNRPLPARRIARPAALLFGVGIGLAGVGLLALLVDRWAAGLALGTLLLYVLGYTPLKRHSPLNTLVGAVVGALPPLIGWVAASGGLAVGAWVLAGILFVWQIPHFLALAWMYRDDYARGGFRMLPIVDPRGHLTGLVVVMYTLVLLPLTLMLTMIGVTGWAYAVGAVLLGTGFLAAGVRLEHERTVAAARRLFLASVIYLPILLGLMVLDRRASSEGEMLAVSHGTPRVGHQSQG